MRLREEEWVSKMFPGFRSLCITPILCIANIASPVECELLVIYSVNSSENKPSRLAMFLKVLGIRFTQNFTRLSRYLIRTTCVNRYKNSV